jgi:hypothetical protein
MSCRIVNFFLNGGSDVRGECFSAKKSHGALLAKI